MRPRPCPRPREGEGGSLQCAHGHGHGLDGHVGEGVKSKVCSDLHPNQKYADAPDTAKPNCCCVMVGMTSRFYFSQLI